MSELVRAMKIEAAKRTLKIAKSLIKKNKKSREVLADIEYHFREKDSWPLSFSHYQVESELPVDQFVLILGKRYLIQQNPLTTLLEIVLNTKNDLK